MSIKSRVVAGIGANAYGQMVTVGIQLLGVPIFLHFWDTARYGTWLMLSAVPSYFSLADVGMVTAAGNKMTMEMGRGDLAGANRTFQSALVFMCITCLVVFALTAIVLAMVDLSWGRVGQYRLTLVLLVTTVLVAFFNGLAETTFRSTGRYGVGTFIGQSIRSFEWAGGMIGLYLHQNFVSVAAGMLIARFAGVATMIGYSALSTPQIKWGVRQASVMEIRRMVKPAAMFMMFPIINAMSFQGFTLLVGSIFGPVSVAVFNTYRTIARVTIQATSILSSALGPEMSRLYGSHNRDVLYQVYRKFNRLSLLFSTALPLLLGVVAPRLLDVWTRGRIPYNASVLWAMLIYAGISGSWHVSRTLLLSINRHTQMALVSFAATAASFFAGYFAGRLFSLSAVVWVLAVAELATSVIVHRMANQILDEGEAFASAPVAK